MTDRLRVWLFAERGLGGRHLDEVVRIFDRNPGPVLIAKQSQAVLVEKDHAGELTWDRIFRSLRDLRRQKSIPPENFIFLLTKSPNAENWFAAEDEQQMRNGFGHVGDFSWATTAPPSVISAHYILKAIFNALVTERGTPWQSLWHEEPRGCFYDFCSDKRQITFKLRTADICGDCMQVLRSLEMPDALIGQTARIMEQGRMSAINTQVFLPQPSPFETWPFPVAATRQKAVQAHLPTIRFFLLLDHFDCLVRYLVIAQNAIAKRQLTIEDRPSLGWWVQKLGQAGRDDIRLREILQIAESEHIVRKRNELRGHGWLNHSDATYVTHAASLEGAIEQIEDAADTLLRRYQLVVPHQVTIDAGRNRVRAELLVGSNLFFPTTEILLDESPQSLGLRQTGAVYLFDSSEKRYLPVEPFILFKDCPSCNLPRLLINDGGTTYIDAYIGHRVKITAPPSG